MMIIKRPATNIEEEVRLIIRLCACMMMELLIFRLGFLSMPAVQVPGSFSNGDSNHKSLKVNILSKYTEQEPLIIVVV